MPQAVADRQRVEERDAAVPLQVGNGALLSADNAVPLPLDKTDEGAEASEDDEHHETDLRPGLFRRHADRGTCP
jgi:hypothetical protein